MAKVAMKLRRYILHQSDIVIAVSSNMKNYLHKELELPTERIVIIPSTIGSPKSGGDDWSDLQVAVGNIQNRISF